MLIDYALENICEPTIENVKNYIESYSMDLKLVEHNFKVSMDRLREKEKVWDINISDFIESGYKKKQMFNDFSHPSSYLMIKVCRRVATKIGIEDSTCARVAELDRREQVLWQCLNDALKIIHKSKLCVRKSHKEYIGYYVGMSVDKYIQEYVYIWHDMIIA